MKPNMTRTVPAVVPAVEPIMDDAAQPTNAAQPTLLLDALRAIGAADKDRTVAFADVVVLFCQIYPADLATLDGGAFFNSGKESGEVMKTVRRVFGVRGLHALRTIVASRAGWHSTLAGLIG